jgi:hypothetical protein
MFNTLLHSHLHGVDCSRIFYPPASAVSGLQLGMCKQDSKKYAEYD